jgi:hypothetical protein
MGPKEGEDNTNQLDQSIGSIFDDNRSLISRTDLFPKTEVTMTLINLIKSYVGIGILAIPYGYRQCGIIPATILLVF